MKHIIDIIIYYPYCKMYGIPQYYCADSMDACQFMKYDVTEILLDGYFQESIHEHFVIILSYS